MRINFGAFEKIYQVCKLLDITKKASSVLNEEEIRMCGKLLQDFTTLLRDLDVDLLKSVCGKELKVAKSSLGKVPKNRGSRSQDEEVTNE